MPARRTNPLHRGAGCSRRTAQGRCEAVKQPPFRDIFGVVRSRRTAARVPDTGSDLGTVRQVTQVPGHPNPSADRRGGVVHTPVGKRPGITTLAAAFATAAIAAAIEDGSMDQFVEEATTLAAGNTGILVDGEIVAG